MESVDKTNTNLPAPHSWPKLVVALCVLGLLSVCAAYLIPRYTATRPINLLNVTQAAAASLEQVLAANRVPRDSIQKHGPTLREHRAAHWYEFEYDVRIPSTVDPDALRLVIEKRMRAQSMNLDVFDWPEERGERGINLAYGDIDFASVRLQPTLPERETEPETEPETETQPEPKAAASHAEPPKPAVVSRTNQRLSGESSEAEDKPKAANEPRVMKELTPAVIAELAKLLGVSDYYGETVTAEEMPTLEKLAEAVPHDDSPVVIEVSAPTNEATGRLAIIIDDGGYGGAITERVLKLPPQLTLAILPNTPDATRTSTRAAELGFEVILHMPMENVDPTLYPHEGQLKVDMDETAMQTLVDDALAQIPHAVGINNHMGSRFTSDAKAMSRFLFVIGPKPLYFIDSRTAPDTRAYTMAKAFGIVAEERDVFLDHEDDPEFIRHRFQQALELAESSGRAIAIGHFREATVTVLEELLPTLDASHVQLVHASELAE